MTGDQWYFAYGSNLFIDQKVARTGHIRSAVVCRLPGYRFAFNKQGRGGNIYANIMHDAMAEVWGVAYLCNPEALDVMDSYEGVANGDYKRIQVTVEKEAGEEFEAIAYVACDDFVCEPGRPMATYLRKILSGARHHSLPADYIGQLEAQGR